VGALAAIIAWLGWFTVCPALGFPTLGPAAMLNRVLVPRADPGFWLGWALLLIGLALSAGFYLLATSRSRWRPSIASGAVYAGIVWLLAGTVLMPILGAADSVPPATGPPGLNPPEPMHASFMMLQVGLAAPIAALIAWLLFGLVLGATASWQPRFAMRTLPFSRAMGGGVAIIALIAIGLVWAPLSPIRADSSVTNSRTVLSGPVKTLPKGADYVSILELSQTPGATLGPHIHSYVGIAYSLRGVATVAFVNGPTARVASGEATFIVPAHAHRNTDDVLPTAILAILIVALVVAVCMTSLQRNRRGGRFFPMALALLIAASAAGIWNPWSNDWLFISVRGVANRGGVMPLPTASRLYESPNLMGLPSGPYTETLDEVTVAPAAPAWDVGSAGAKVLFVLDGRVAVQSAGASPVQLGARQATLLQPGVSAGLLGANGQPAHLLIFSVTPGAAAP